MIDVTHQMVALADIVLPGASEGQVLLGTKDPIEIGRTYLEMGASTVIVKDGGQGATVITRDEVLHRNVFPGPGRRHRRRRRRFRRRLHQRHPRPARPCAAACAGPPRSARWPPPAPATGTACRTGSS